MSTELDARIKQNKADQEKLAEEGRRLEAEKDRLVLGDYGTDEKGEVLLIVEYHGCMEWELTSMNRQGASCGAIGRDGRHMTREFTKKGNVYNDTI
jgi:hypothetical protein